MGIRVQLVSVSLFVCLAVAAGCSSDGEGRPDGGGGSAGSAGRGGAGAGGGGTGGSAGAAGVGGAAGSAGRGGAGGTAAVGGSAGAAGAGGVAGSAGRGGSGGAAGIGGAAGSAGMGGATGTPPNAVTGLAASVTNRRRVTMRLAWTVPASGAAVASYDVRYAKVPITAANFDDTAVTVAVPFTGTPAAAGQADGIDVTPLYIETDYYFAVAAKGSGGARSAIVATTAAVRAAFTVTVLSGMAATDHMGHDVDGSGDFGRPAGAGFTADGMSDLLVGSNAGSRAYLFMGASTGYAATPTVTFTGATTGFGSAIANAGDIDGDGLADIAITSTNDATGKVFIYSRKTPPASWGTTTSWPATLTDAQANYVISADAGLMGMSFRNLARLGNFDGAGADDLLVAFRLRTAATGDGAVFVVKGSASFASVTIPNPAGALEVDGALTGISFGVANVGLGSFLSQGFVSSSSTASTVYAFAGQATAGPITAAMNTDSVVTTAADRYGLTLGFIGPLGASPGAVSIGATVGQYVDIHLGTAASGPFLGAAGGAPAATVRLTIDATAGNSFGIVNIGGGIKGTSMTASVIGDASSDLIVAGQAGVNLPLYVFDGSVIPSLSGSVNVGAPTAAVAGRMVTISGRMPTGWPGYSTGTIIPDSDGDGFGDFAVGEFTTSTVGRVVVFR